MLRTSQNGNRVISFGEKISLDEQGGFGNYSHDFCKNFFCKQQHGLDKSWNEGHSLLWDSPHWLS